MAHCCLQRKRQLRSQLLERTLNVDKARVRLTPESFQIHWASWLERLPLHPEEPGGGEGTTGAGLCPRPWHTFPANRALMAPDSCSSDPPTALQWASLFHVTGGRVVLISVLWLRCFFFIAPAKSTLASLLPFSADKNTGAETTTTTTTTTTTPTCATKMKKKTHTG